MNKIELVIRRTTFGDNTYYEVVDDAIRYATRDATLIVIRDDIMNAISTITWVSLQEICYE